MTTCREPNGFITQVQILISKWRSYSFRRDNHLSYRKESWGCNIQLGTEVSNWLHQRLWKDHHLRLTERIPLHSRGAKGTNIMRPLLTLRRVPVIRFRYEGPDQRGFSFCHATIKSRKQFAARNSHKGDGRTTAWAILFNDGTLKRRGYLIRFRHALWQIPLPRWKCIFVNNFSVHRFRSSFPLYQNSFLVRTQCYCSLRASAVSWQSDHPAICLSSVCRLLLFAADQVSSAVYRIWSTPGIAKRRALLRPVSFDHIVLFWLSASTPWSKHRVIIYSMLQYWITQHIPLIIVFI